MMPPLSPVLSLYLPMKTLTITITGETEDDLCFSIDEVRRLVDEGYLSGFNSNETASYNFDIKES
jgi:hypothetical protein